MLSAPRSWIRLLLLLGAMLAMGSMAAQAREGFYLGAGLAAVSSSGDLKGTHFVTNTAGTEADVLGKLDSGAGIALEIGYGFNKYIGIEYLGTGSSHTAKADKSVINVNDTTATVGTGLLGIRLTAPVAKSFELFARLGLGTGSVVYDEYSIPGSTAGSVFTPSGAKGKPFSVSGTGTGYGAGFEILGEHLGFELAYTVLDISLSQAKGASSSGSLPTAQKEQFTVVTGNLLYHF